MSLGQDQRDFTKAIATLITWAYEHGYEITFGDAYRDPRLHGEFGEKVSYGNAKSFHKKRLAIDLNLFRDGKYLTKTSDHQVLGQMWEAMGGTWGGRFAKKDGNHYSWLETR